MSKRPRSILCDRRLLLELSWDEIDDLVIGRAQRKLLRGDFSVDELVWSMRTRTESDLTRYRSRHGLLDIENIGRGTFRQQLRFEKDDIADLVTTLRMPAYVKSSQNVVVSGREAL
ncbi:hypothetical protein MTO96_041748 [Rhipicephalus appendiculatus]